MPEDDLDSFYFSFTYKDAKNNVRKIEYPAKLLKQAEGESLNEALYKMAAH